MAENDPAPAKQIRIDLLRNNMVAGGGLVVTFSNSYRRIAVPLSEDVVRRIEGLAREEALDLMNIPLLELRRKDPRR